MGLAVNRMKAGDRVGKLKLVEFVGVVRRHSSYRCLCACGGTIIAREEALFRRVVRSCGCLHRLTITPGRRFGRLSFIKRLGYSNNNQVWLLKCDCGTKVKALHGNVMSGRTQACGCLQRERIVKHGRHGSTEYKSWHMMIQRCTNSNGPEWHNYGGRGITVCARWRRSFPNFFKDMGLKPSPKHSIDRINNDGNYTPGNCKWSTPKEQANNMRRNKAYGR